MGVWDTLMVRSHIIAYTELCLAMVFAGSSVVVGKLIVADFPVFLASELSLIVALFVVAIVHIVRMKPLPRLGRKDLLFLFLQTLFGLFLFRIFVLYGLDSTSAIEAGIITSTTPAWVALIAFFFLKERISSSKWLGVILIIVGIAVLNISGKSGGAVVSAHFLGNLLIVGAVIGEALFTIFRKSVSGAVDALSGTTYVILLGALLFLPFALYEFSQFSFGGVSASSWLAVVYYGAFVTVASFFLWFDGVSKVSTATAGAFTAVMPLSALLLSVLLLGEQILFTHILGILCTLVGISVSLGFLSKQDHVLSA